MTTALQQPDIREAAGFGLSRLGWREETLCSRTEVSHVIDRVLTDMTVYGYPDEDLFAVRLALEEALVNAIKHGHQDDPTKQARLRYHVDDENVLAQVEDEGPGFDPNHVADPLAEENLHTAGGRGVFLMHRLMTWVSYNDRGNCVTLCKERSGF